MESLSRADQPPEDAICQRLAAVFAPGPADGSMQVLASAASESSGDDGEARKPATQPPSAGSNQVESRRSRQSAELLSREMLDEFMNEPMEWQQDDMFGTPSSSRSREASMEAPLASSVNLTGQSAPHGDSGSIAAAEPWEDTGPDADLTDLEESFTTMEVKVLAAQLKAQHMQHVRALTTDMEHLREKVQRLEIERAQTSAQITFERQKLEAAHKAAKAKVESRGLNADELVDADVEHGTGCYGKGGKWQKERDKWATLRSSMKQLDWMLERSCSAVRTHREQYERGNRYGKKRIRFGSWVSEDGDDYDWSKYNKHRNWRGGGQHANGNDDYTNWWRNKSSSYKSRGDDRDGADWKSRARGGDKDQQSRSVNREDEVRHLDPKMQKLNRLIQEKTQLPFSGSKWGADDGGAEDLHASKQDTLEGSPTIAGGTIVSTLQEMFPDVAIRLQPPESDAKKEEACTVFASDSHIAPEPEPEAEAARDAEPHSDDDSSIDADDEADPWTKQRVEEAAQDGFGIRRNAKRVEIKLTMGGKRHPNLTEAGMKKYCRWLRRKVATLRKECGPEELRQGRATVDISHSGLTDEMLWTFLQTIIELELNFIVFKLFGNCIGQGGVLALCEFIDKTQQAEPLQELHLSHNEIQGPSVLELLRAMNRKSSWYPVRRLGYKRGDEWFSPAWLQVNRNKVESPLELLRSARAEGLSFCEARDMNSCTVRSCCVGQSASKCPLVHLYRFNEQNTKRSAEAGPGDSTCESRPAYH